MCVHVYYSFNKNPVIWSLWLTQSLSEVGMLQQRGTLGKHHRALPTTWRESGRQNYVLADTT
jgi:hypothetical protein